MIATETITPRTEEELQRLLEQGYEIVDDIPVEQHMSALSSMVGFELSHRMGTWNENKRFGWIWPADNSFKCFPHKPTLVRKADVSFIRKDRLPAAKLVEGYVHIHPDLAIEVVSPNDLFDEVNENVYDWLEAGAQLVWVVCLKPRMAYVHRASGEITKLQLADELDGEDVLPGFRCRVRDLFPVIEESESK